jgi:hypothetical protein
MARRFSARPARYPRPDNSGGLIDQAAYVADLFLPEGEAVLEVRQVAHGPKSERIRTCGAARARDLDPARARDLDPARPGARRRHRREYGQGRPGQQAPAPRATTCSPSARTPWSAR